MDLGEQIKKLIDEQHDKSEGMCGISIPEIHQKTKTPYKQLNKTLKKLHEEKYFKLRRGINGYLLFRINEG